MQSGPILVSSKGNFYFAAKSLSVDFLCVATMGEELISRYVIRNVSLETAGSLMDGSKA